MTKNRREFLQSLLALGASAGLLPLIACGDDGGGDDTSTGDTGTGDTGGGDTGGGDTGTGDTGTGDTGTGDTGSGDTGSGDTGTGDGGAMCESVNTEISANHMHEAVIPAADVNAGAEMTYDIQGSSPHAHSITLTAADMTTLQGGGMVTVTSVGGGHTHDVTVSCGG